jgi:hypothetical protein
VRAAEVIAADGYALISDVIGAEDILELQGTAKAGAGRGGVRNLLDVAGMRELALSEPLMKLVREVLGPEAKVVRGILFDKRDGANWKVPWHQDVTIAVAQRVDADGFGPWSNKAGVLHVQPPADVLEQMISVRLHLDDCPEENGALRVLPGTHLQDTGVVCEVDAGGVLMMRPLLIHASSAATQPRHRRVVHFDYANVQLPAGMGWAAVLDERLTPR